MVVDILELEKFKEILSADLPVLVDFWAPWCGPCKTMLPIVSKVAEQYNEKVTVVKLNIDNFPDLASKYGIRSIPHCILFHEGVIKGAITGLQTVHALAEFIEKHVPELQG